MVYWIEPLTLDQTQRVVGTIPIMQCLALILSFSKTFFPHCCSPPRCINGYPANVICRLIWHMCAPDEEVPGPRGGYSDVVWTGVRG